MPDKNSYTRSVERVTAVLKSFSLASPQLSLAEIYPKTGIPKSTAHRILSTLVKDGLLDYNPANAKYSIGPELYAIGSIFINSTDIIKAAEPVLKTLNSLTQELANLAIMDNKGNITIILKEESTFGLRIGLPAGFSSPAYAHALGKALLSELDDDQLDALYPDEKLAPLTKYTVATKSQLKRELEQVRKTGVAYNNQQALEGAVALASVIRNQTGKAIAATAISAPVSRINETKIKAFSAIIKPAAALISYRLGYQNTETPIRSVSELQTIWEQYIHD